MFYDCSPANTTVEKGTDLFGNSFQGVKTMFYLISPKSTMFRAPEDVPDFFKQAWPFFLIFIIMEHIILMLQGKNGIRLNDSLASISNGIFMEIGRLMWRSTESYIYTWMYTYYRFVELPWNISLTWYAAALGVDLCYYWMHRACHGIHILWAQHQVHHSSEDFNMAVGIRQSILQGWFGFIFYLPLAFVIPPAQFVMHYQFNYLFMFWIHTEVIKSLGPLEYILNTPSHHRVHHGSNKYCLDVNFGGVLIIWDRLFGTFRPETDKIHIVYGIINNQPSFNPLHLQTFYTAIVIEKFNKLSLWGDKLKALVLRPSWEPGMSPRRFTEEDLKEAKYQVKYDVPLPTWCSIYIMLHYTVTLFGLFELMSNFVEMTPITVLVYITYLITSLTIMGMIFDNSKHTPILEALRCAALGLLTKSVKANIILLNILQIVYMFSAIFWGIYTLKVLNLNKNLGSI